MEDAAKLRAMIKTDPTVVLCADDSDDALVTYYKELGSALVTPQTGDALDEALAKL